jgi:hypothetical protein
LPPGRAGPGNRCGIAAAAVFANAPAHDARTPVATNVACAGRLTKVHGRQGRNRGATTPEVPVQISSHSALSTLVANAALGAQRPVAAASPVTPVTVSPADSPEARGRLDKYLAALGAPLKMGHDASRMASALVSTMQSIVLERPDLATASFDFSNTGLVDAAKRFHDDAVEGYALWSNADGNPLTQHQLEAVGQKADDLTGFLELFSKLEADAAKGMFSDGAYYAPSGARFRLDHDPKTAIGFLALMQSAQVLSEGTAKWVAPDGDVHHFVLKRDLFANARVMPNFFPSDANTLGLHEVA